MVSCSPAEQLDDPAREAQPATVPKLKQWMRDRISRYNRFASGGTLNPDQLKGKIYTASSLKWRHDNTIEQTGNAPNYFDGLWTLATCKHYMRSRSTFQNWFSEEGGGVFRPTKPLFVYTVAEKANHEHTNGRNAVASIAMVTHGFETVEAYARFLKENGPKEAFTNRRTRRDDSEAVEDIPRHAQQVGDCHVTSSCEVGRPTGNHQHVSETGENCRCGDPRHSKNDTKRGECPKSDDRPLWKRDIETDHVKCLSMPGYWTTWQNPAFVATPPNSDHVGQSSSGHNIHSFSTVQKYLREY